jgi:hypothetical protein
MSPSPGTGKRQRDDRQGGIVTRSLLRGLRQPPLEAPRHGVKTLALDDGKQIGSDLLEPALIAKRVGIAVGAHQDHQG